jgi:hypothetical protein
MIGWCDWPIANYRPVAVPVHSFLESKACALSPPSPLRLAAIGSKPSYLSPKGRGCRVFAPISYAKIPRAVSCHHGVFQSKMTVATTGRLTAAQIT